MNIWKFEYCRLGCHKDAFSAILWKNKIGIYDENLAFCLSIWESMKSKKESFSIRDTNKEIGRRKTNKNKIRWGFLDFFRSIKILMFLIIISISQISICNKEQQLTTKQSLDFGSFGVFTFQTQAHSFLEF